jgi:hypothetical protein
VDLFDLENESSNRENDWSFYFVGDETSAGIFVCKAQSMCCQYFINKTDWQSIGGRQKWSLKM